jgi:hypothetical protein
MSVVAETVELDQAAVTDLEDSLRGELVRA